jgi:hypothetical protein
VRWFNKWSSNLNEVLEVSVLVSGTTWSSSLSLVLSDNISKNFSPSVIRDGFSGWKTGLLLGNSLIEEGLQLILKRSLSGLSELGILIQLLQLGVVGLVGEKLERMNVVGDQLELSVSLVSESSGTTVLDLLGWSFRGQRNSEKLSEGDDESLLKF